MVSTRVASQTCQKAAPIWVMPKMERVEWEKETQRAFRPIGRQRTEHQGCAEQDEGKNLEEIVNYGLSIG